jgi:hypothetical protein
MSVFSIGAPRARQAATAVVVLTLMSATPVLAQQAAAPAAQPAAQPAPQALTFATGAGLLFHQIKADRAADFEWVMERLKEAMSKSEDAKVKEQASGFKVFKTAADAVSPGNITFVVVVNPATAEADYSMTNLLNLVYKAFPDQQQEIFKRVSGAFGGATNRINLQPVSDFSK